MNHSTSVSPYLEARTLLSLFSSHIILREITFFLLFLSAWGAMYYPALFEIDTGFMGGIRADPAAYTWYVMHNIQRVLTWPSAWMNASYFYPFGNSLAYSDSFILPALLAKPIYLISGNYSLAYNSVMVLASVLNGYLTFCFARHLTKETIVSLLAGFCFMCLPFFYGHLGHPQLQWAFFLPAIAIVSLIYVEKRNLLAGSAIGFFVVCQFLATVYYSMIGYVLAALIIFAYGLLRLKTLTSKDLRDLFLLGVVNIPWAIAIFFISAPYRDARDVLGAMPESLVRHFSAGFTSYMAGSPKHLMWGHLSSLTPNGSWLLVGLTILVLCTIAVTSLVYLRDIIGERDTNFPKAARILALIATASVLFLILAHVLFGNTIKENFTVRAFVVAGGLWPILLVTVAFLVLRGLVRREQSLTRLDYAYIILFLGVFFFFASFGIIGGHGSEYSKPGLFHQLRQLLPGYNSMRAIYRFGVVAGMMIIVLGAFGLSILFKQKIFSTPLSKMLLVVATFGLVAAEYKTFPYHTSKDRPRPRIYKVLERIPGDEAVVNIPFLTPLKDGLSYSRFHTAYMHWTFPTGRPVMAGWSSKLPRFYQKAGPDIDTFPAQTSLNILGQIVGLKYVVFFREHAGKDFKKRKFLEALEAVDDQVTTLFHDKRNNFLFEIHPVLNLFELRYPELYLPPSMSQERTLHFEIRIDSSLQKPLKLSIQTGYEYVNGEKLQKIEVIELASRDSWESVSLPLPKSTHTVIPHKVAFLDIETSGAKRILVRNLSSEP